MSQVDFKKSCRDLPRPRVPTAQAKQGKWSQKIPVREFGNFAKTQGIWFAHVVNSLILKVKDISIFAVKIPFFFFFFFFFFT